MHLALPRRPGRAAAAAHLAAALALLVFTPPPRAAAQQPAPADTSRASSSAGMAGMEGMEMMDHDQAPASRLPELPMARAASGTAWQPDASPMHGVQRRLGRWSVMAHGEATFMADGQRGPRGGGDAVVLNWGMLQAARPAAGGRLTLRGMASAEPFTVPGAGYRELLQTGEVFRGRSVHDRQHPHDLFMELSATYERALARGLGAFVYAAPVGEPATGPVAYVHRASAQGNPFSPIGHHWQDATHVSFGVLTVGAFTRLVRLEGSVFNGREPDEVRTNFDYRGRSLDSYSGRLTVNPGRRWSASASYAYLRSPEPVLIQPPTSGAAGALAPVPDLAPGTGPREHITFTPSFPGQAPPSTALHRASLAVMSTLPLWGGSWSSTLAATVQKHAYQTARSPSVLLESALERRALDVFTRAEWVRKSDNDLVVEGALTRPPVRYPPGATPPPVPTVYYDVGELTLGAVRAVAHPFGMELGLGAAGTAYRVPAALAGDYGSRTPLGGAVYVRVRPALMRMR